MTAGELTPPSEAACPFQLSSLKRMHTGPGCYALTNFAGEIIYIGQAANLRSRLLNHFDGPKRDALTSKGRISTVEWRGVDTRGLDSTERGWIGLYALREGELPPLNKQDGPC